MVFIDMRGSLGDIVCTEGDVNYDLSKVYQSLCGYDFIILDKALDQTAVDILDDLKEVTRPWHPKPSTVMSSFAILRRCQCGTRGLSALL